MSNNSTLKTVEEIIKEARSSAEFISPEQAKLLLAKSNTLVIDVREPAEHNEACIPHSINIPRGVLEMKIAALAPTPEHEIIIHSPRVDAHRCPTTALSLWDITT